MALRPVHNEQELLSAISKGNQKAFTELFYAYHNQLGEYVMLLMASEEAAKEIVQDVFVKIWMNRAQLPEIHNFSGYLFILTRNYTLNCLRQQVNERKRKNAFESSLEPATVLEEVDYLPEGYEQVIDRAVAQLPPSQQMVFNLKRAGKKNAEIADEMGISPESVKKYHQWAMRSIGNFVKQHRKVTAILFCIAVLNK